MHLLASKIILGRYLRLVVGLSFCGLASTSFATPISSNTFAFASAGLSTNLNVDQEVDDTDAQGATLNPLSATALASVTDGVDTATASVRVDATWVNQDQGAVLFENFFETLSPGGFVVGNVTPFGRFTHSFTADSDGSLSVAYETIFSFSPDPLGIAGYRIGVSGLGNQFAGSGGANTTGVASFDLLEGNAYTLTILSNINLGGTLGRREVNAEGIFNWTFLAEEPPVEVPEPGAAGLLAVGLIGLVTTTRRQCRAGC